MDSEEESSQLGLDADRSIPAKLGRTLMLFVLAGFCFIFTALVFGPGWNPWWQLVAEVAIEICWSFWCLALVCVWWQPNWLRRHYLHAERKMLGLAALLKYAIIPLLLLAIILIAYLTHIGVLPVPAR
jgi:hypothetical protein